MTATRAQVKKRIRELGGDFEVLRKPPYLDCQVYPPHGKRFVEQGAHVFVGTQNPHNTPEDVYADMLERMAPGVEDCDDAECDACRGDEEED